MDMRRGRSLAGGQRRELVRLVDSLQGEGVGRREFLRRCAALGVSVATARSVLDAIAAQPAVAAGTPRRGGVLKAAFSADPAGFDPVRGPSGMPPAN